MNTPINDETRAALAGLAASGIIKRDGIEHSDPEGIAKEALEFADALLRELSKPAP
jgi:hypothetical protein